jgi:glycosyltransferase involved in cell wall biosynthesis
MKSYYISNMEGTSGICKYSRDFFELVLKQKGFEYVSSEWPVSDILTLITSRDFVHIEIGIFQKNELEVLFAMLRSNYKNISVTLHDAPLIKYPFHEFKDPFLTKLSKMYDVYVSNFSAAIPVVRKLKSIYVLSRKGLQAIKSKYKIDNVYYLPHVVNLSETELQPINNNNFIYFGFIGRNKGLEYALKIHQQLLKKFPDLVFYVAGTAMGKEVEYLNYLKAKYQQNVHYLGYVKEGDLKRVFEKATFAIILFKDYKFYWPFSGSLLYSLKKGKIVLTNKMNVVEELIEDGETGYFLSGNKQQDVEKLIKLFGDKPLLENMQYKIHHYLDVHHAPQSVMNHLGTYAK